MRPCLPRRLPREQRGMTGPRPCPGGGHILKLNACFRDRHELLTRWPFSAVGRELVRTNGVQDHHQHIGRRRRAVGAAHEPKEEQRPHSSEAT